MLATCWQISAVLYCYHVLPAVLNRTVHDTQCSLNNALYSCTLVLHVSAYEGLARCSLGQTFSLSTVPHVFASMLLQFHLPVISPLPGSTYLVYEASFVSTYHTPASVSLPLSGYICLFSLSLYLTLPSTLTCSTYPCQLLTPLTPSPLYMDYLPSTISVLVQASIHNVIHPIGSTDAA